MRNLFLFAFTFILVALFAQCNNQNKKDEAECLANDPNPNKSSELAVLMRKMAAHNDTMKAEVLAGKLTTPFPDEFRKILTATPTDSTVKGESFDLFAQGYLVNLEILHASQDDLKAHYNAVVNTCVTCHESSCPGPLVRINKMKI
jgi:hypothetical protein